MAVVQVSKHQNTTIYVGDAIRNRLQRQPIGRAKANEKGNIFAGNTIAGKQERFDSIAARKRMLQRDALKRVQDTFSGQQKMDESIEELKKSQDNMLVIADTAKSEIDLLSERKQKLMENYQVEPDSEEQKNLELLKKSLDPNQNLTEEEYQQLEQMGDLTEYQKTALEIDTQLQVLEEKRQAALNGYESMGKGIIDTQIEELKTHPMVDAQKQAGKIMKDAAEEAAFSLIQEAKDHIDEEMEKKKEQIEKLQKEKEEDKEKLEQKKTKKKEDTKRLEELKQNSNNSYLESQVNKPKEQNRVTKEIKAMVKKQKLLEEDLMGIKVDAFV